MSRTRVDVVVHTHWDREWYLPYQTTVARLAHVLEAVVSQLEAGTLQGFLFDGQTVAFEDIMNHGEPGLVQRVREAVQRGQVALGPWYVMADEFLCSGESLLRNLEIGIADATCAGGLQRVGYLPDSFGHVAQMPRLLREFGIEAAVLWRGADAATTSFEWEAPGGVSVGTVFLPEGYYQHALNVPGAHPELLGLLRRLKARSTVPRLLFTQGGDHLLPGADMAARLAAFNASQEEFELVPATLADHAQALLAATSERERVFGELRANRQAFVLPDVLSTRRYLKRLHDQAEDRLLGAIEPLLACTVPAARWPARALEQAWRLLLQQQAHDSICGCSTDAVHREMEQRFVSLHQRLDALQAHALAAAGMVSLRRHAGGPDVWADDARCTVFNPLAQRLQGWQVLRVFLTGPRHAALRVTRSGRALPHVLLEATPHEEIRSPLDDFPERLQGWSYALALPLDMPGLAAIALEIEAVPDAAPGAGAPRADEVTPGATAPGASAARIENATLALWLDASGTLHLTDRRSGTTHSPLLQWLHELDAGDSYNWSPPPEPSVQVASCLRAQGAWQRDGAAELRLSIRMDVPAGLAPDRRGAAAERVCNEGTLCLRLLGDEPTVHAELVWHNRSRDQRTRLLLPLSDATSPLWTDTAFAWTERPQVRRELPGAVSRQEMPVAVVPTGSALHAAPWWLAHEAMHECEAIEHAGRPFLALTLVRSVGFLSRRDLLTRGVGAGPDIATPEAQCLGTEVFRWCFGPGTPAQALPQARRLRRPPLVLRGHRSRWPAPLDIGNAALVVSSVRRLGAEGPLELRLWNPTEHTQTLALAPDHWQTVRADGIPEAPAAADRHAVGPYALLTLRARA
jgi:dienelactone hydrolase